MAGPLTWRDVAAPDFRPAMEGLQNFSRSLTDTLSGAQKALTEFDTAKTTEISQQAMLDLLTNYQGSPDKLQADLASGAFTQKYDPKRLNGDALALIARRPKDLLDFASGQVDLTDKKDDLAFQSWDRGNTMADRSAMDGAKPIATALIGAYSTPGASGGMPTAQEASARVAKIMANPEAAAAIGKLTPAQQAALLTDPQKILSGNLELVGSDLNNKGKALGNEQARLNITTGQWEFGQRKKTVAETEEGNAAFKMINDSYTDPQAALGALGSMNLSPGAYAHALDMLQSKFNIGGVSGSNSGSTGASGGSSGGLGGPGDVQRTMGWTPRGVDNNSNDSVDNKIKIISDRIGAAPDAGLSKQQFLALDMTALEGKPAAANNFGNMKNTDGSWKKFNSRAEYDQAQKAWLERRWNEGARTIRDAVEGRVVNGGASRSTINTVGATIKSAQVGQARGSDNWFARLNDGSNANEVAAALRGSKEKAGPMGNVPEPWIARQVSQIREQSKNPDGTYSLNAAQAGRILHDAMTREAKNSGVLVPGLPFAIPEKIFRDRRDVNLGNGYRINWGQVDTAVKSARNGDMNRDSVRTAGINEALAAVTTADTQYNAAKAEWDAFLSQNAARPQVIAANRERMMAKVNAAKNKWENAHKTYDPQLIPSEVKPEEEQPWYKFWK